MSPTALPPRARREQELLERGSPLTIQVDDHTVMGHSWGAGPTVLVQHGWGSRATSMWAFVKALEPHFTVIAVDAPGHGDSEGTRSHMFLFARTIAELSRLHGPLHGIIGHSIGATAIPTAITLGAQAERYVMMSARNELEDLLDRFFEITQLDKSLMPGVHQNWADEFGWDAVIAATPSSLVQQFFQPALIIHDEEDEEIRVSEAHTIHESWKGSELLVTSGLGHIRITRSAEVAERVRDFLLA